MDDFIGVVCGIILVVFVTAMLWKPDIYVESITHAQKLCDGNGGLKFISENSTRFSKSTCNNGAVFSYDNSVIKGE